MSQSDRYVFMPSFSIEPNQISLYNRIFVRDKVNELLVSSSDAKVGRTVNNKNVESSNNITRSHHNFQISNNAYRTIKRKINWLYHLSKSRQVKTYNGKTIYNFKCGFITLTIPSKQLECTKDFTNLYFNQFLTEIRQRTKMENYVWRLEFQKNGNVHYHIITDTYLDYFFIRNIWNRIISKGEYINNYQNRFVNLNLSEYRNIVDSGHKLPFKEVARKYALGKKDNWTQPNSVDVKSVLGSQSISNYLSKYFSKDAKSGTTKNELDTVENSEGLRLWFCSRSLSKLKTITDFVEAVDFSAKCLVDGVKTVKKVFHRYCVCYYFDFRLLPALCKKELSQLLKSYANSLNYLPSQ